VAQYGRGVGVIQATAAQIMTQFANNLKAQIGADHQPSAVMPIPAAPGSPPTLGTPAPPPAAKPISGLSLMAKVIWDAILRLFTGRPPPA
jgi:hypothetical protein